MRAELLQGALTRVGDAGLVQPFDELGGAQPHGRLGDDSVEFGPVGDPVGVAQETGVVRQGGRSSTISQNATHSWGFWRPRITFCPSRVGNGP